jgi:hypothetical protein
MQIPHTISVSTKKTKLKVQFVISLNIKHTTMVSTNKFFKLFFSINLKRNANLNDEPQMQKRVNFVEFERRISFLIIVILRKSF